MEKQNPNAVATIRKYERAVALNKEQAMEILKAVWPKAPESEMTRAAMLCRDYQLNPLMKHIFLVPFNEGKQNESWVTIMSIQAKRLLASRRGTFSYIDDTPRIMSEAEQIKIYGKAFPNRINAIVKLRDPHTGAEVSGYGWWPGDKGAYGGDKGNSVENMAFIRAESQAIQKLRPGEMPEAIETMDANYIEAEGVRIIEGTGEIISEPKSVAAEEAIPTPAAEQPKSNEPPVPVATPEKKPEAKKQTTPPVEDNRPDDAKISKAEVDNILFKMKEANLSMSDLGNIMVQTLKWQPAPAKISNFTVKQYREILPHLQKK